VSRLWPDRLFLFIAPERIVLVRSHGRLRPQVVAKHIVPVTAAASASPWQSALDTLTQLLQSDPQWQSLEVHAVLSNHFVRYQLIPWSALSAGADVRAAYVRESFVQIYGDVAAGWVYSVSPPRQGEAAFASAIDSALLAQLEQAVGHTQSRLHSVAPHLMPTFNHARRTLTQQDVWFVQVDAASLLLLCISAGHWQAVSSHQVDAAQWPAQLPMLLEREWHLYGTGALPRKVVIAAADMQPVVIDDHGTWCFDWLPPVLRHGLSTDADLPYAVALGA
jgi:hypothetical protein